MLRIIFILASASIFANLPQMPEANSKQNIALNNTILAKVGDTTISVYDVKKKMDLAFLRNFSHLADSTQARFQFYDSSWRKVLSEMIDNKLILEEAEQKKVTIADGDIREEIENRFGPNVMVTLDKIGLSYADTVKMVREEMIVQRMMWWFVHSKAINQVTPQDIRQAYRSYVKEHPSYDELKYQVITIKEHENSELPKEVHDYLLARKEHLDEALSKISENFPSCQISAEYTAQDKQLSEAYKGILSQLDPWSFSAPIVQKSKNDNSQIVKIFILKEKNHFACPEFETMTAELKNKLVEKSVALEAKNYLEKLRSTYPYYETASNDLKPFSLQ